MRKHIHILFLFLTCTGVMAGTGERTMKVTGHWLNIPVSHEADRRAMTIVSKGHRHQDRIGSGAKREDGLSVEKLEIYSLESIWK